MRLSLLIGLAGYLCSFSAASLPLVTEKRFYRAYGDAYQQTQARTAFAEASDAYCDNASLLTNRADARRCRIQQTEFDPCFVDEDKPTKRVKCIQTPWSSEYQPLNNISEIVPFSAKQLDMSKDWPWGIELADGERCLRSTAASSVFQGQPIRYDCQNQGQLFGYIQHCKEPWSMLLKKRNGEVVSVALKRVWF